MKFRMGSLYTQKLAHLCGRATTSSVESCLLFHQPDSEIHMFSGCWGKFKLQKRKKYVGSE